MAIMRILVTGANGFVGKNLCAALAQQGFFVRAATRKSLSQKEGFETVTIGDIDGLTDWAYALSNVDVVIHLAARVHMMKEESENPSMAYHTVNVEGTLNLARQAVCHGVKRFIFLSSVKVNGEQTSQGKPFKETDIPNPQDDYGVSKLQAEEGLFLIAKKSGMEIVVIRPPLVYGSGVKANFANMFNAVQHGFPLPFGNINNKRSLVYVDNLISLIICCIGHPAAANQLFFVSDGKDLSTTELLNACATALGLKAKLLPVPQNWLRFLIKLLGKDKIAQRLCDSLQVDLCKARQYLGWVPPISLSDGLKTTALSMHKD